MTARATRFIAVAGLASFLLISVAGLLVPLWDAPDTSASAAEISSWAQANRGELLAAVFLYSLAMGLFLCFAAGLWALLRESEPGPGALAAAFALGAVALAALVLAAFVSVAVLAYRVPQPSVVRPLYDVTFGLLAVSGIPTAVCMGAYAVLVFRRARLPAWTGWLAVAGALAHVVIAASFANSSGFLSLEGDVIIWVPATLFVWILATSIALLQGRPASN